MKKTVKLFLVALCMLTILTGCYQNDTVIKVSPFGKVNVEVSTVVNDEGANMYLGSSYDEAAPNIMARFESVINGELEEGIEEIKKEIDAVEYKGVKYTGKYDSLEEMYSSQLYTEAMNYSGTPVYYNTLSLNGTEVGVKFAEEKGIFGKTYSAHGSIDYNLFKEMMGINGDGVAVSNLTFKFPFGAFTVSKGNKNFFVPTFEYSGSSDAELVAVDFKVFMPNYFMVLFVVVFILLIVAVVLLLLKVKKLMKIISAFDEEAEDAEIEGESFISEDDENFFEGSEEKIEFADQVENVEVVEEEAVEEEAVEEAVEEMKEETEETEEAETENTEE